MGTQLADFEPIPYRIRIGVTGHRRLADPAAIEALVRNAIDGVVESLFPAESKRIIDRVRQQGTTPISFRVLSPLAEGSDRVVARAVLGCPNARLDAVLPLVLEDYLADFASEESRKEFEELFSRSRRPVSLRTRRIEDDRHDPGDQADLRREAYTKVGQYVVDHCDVLIAVWDGEPSRGRGGTAETVEYAIRQHRRVIQVWDGKITSPNRDRSDGLEISTLEGIDRFNRMPVTPAQRAKYADNLSRDLFEKPKAAGAIPGAVREFVTRCLFPYYAQASIIAKKNQDRYYQVGRITYALSAAAVGCAALGVLFRSLAVAGFGTELILMIFILVTLRRAQDKQVHETWIENRYLTERIRCGVFMAICGVEPKPIMVPLYMGHSQTANDWTVRAFDEIWDRLPPLAGCKQEQCEALNAFVGEAWIKDQRDYHEKKEADEGRLLRHLETASSIVLRVTVAAAALHLLLVLWEPPPGALELVNQVHHGLHQWLAFIALLFPTIAASLAGMIAHREHLRLEKRSDNMSAQLSRFGEQLEFAKSPKEFEELLQQLDEEIMLRETQDWLMLMRYVEIKAS